MNAEMVEKLLDPYPLLHGFKRTFPWSINPHANPFYSPLYYLLCRGMIAKNILEIGLEAGYSSYMLGTAAKENGGKFFGVDKHRLKAERIKKKMDELETRNTHQNHGALMENGHRAGEWLGLPECR